MSKLILESDTGAKFSIKPESGLSADKEIIPANINGDATQKFKVADATAANEALSKGQLLAEIQNIDGSGSGIDADKLDGLDSSNFAKNDLSNTNDSTILSKIKNVDGSGSGLDADLLDGLDSTAFAKLNGDSNQKFKVADAVDNDDAVSKSQLLAHYPTLIYVEYTTDTSDMSISQPNADTWFDLPHVKITIPKDGIYVVTYNVRMWQDYSTNNFWKKHRVLKNGTEITKSDLFGLNKNDTNTNGDSTYSKTFIDSFLTGDVLQVQGYWGQNTSGSTYYSNYNGGTSIIAIKIG